MNRFRHLLTAGCLLLFGFEVPAAGGEVAVAVNKNVPVDSLTCADLKKILLGERQFWASDLKITLMIPAPIAHERDVMIKDILEMTEPRFRDHWTGKVFRAEAISLPRTIYSPAMALALLAKIPGSLTFINWNALLTLQDDATQLAKDVKVLRVDGHLPGEKGYPLH